MSFPRPFWETVRDGLCVSEAPKEFVTYRINMAADSRKKAKMVGGMVNKTVAVSAKSSQPSSRPFLGSAVNMRRP